MHHYLQKPILIFLSKKILMGVERVENVQPLSLITTIVLLIENGEQKSLGTGFFYQGDEGRLFLATNFHVITGIDPLERNSKPLIGDSIIIQLRDRSGNLSTKTLPLYKDGKPLWLEHPTDKQADIVLVPLEESFFYNSGVKAISKKVQIPNVKINPSSAVVMIGYPHGYHDKANYLPIWKTGSIASEPEIDFDGNKLIVVDISAFPGMSGSPAFYVTHNGYLTKKGDMIMDVGMKVHFLGVYASMQMLNSDLYLEQAINKSDFKVSHSESLQLGHVWKAELLEEILTQNTSSKLVSKTTFDMRF